MGRETGGEDLSRKRARESYDENAVKTLSSLEHIRLRSGMYIGRLGDGANSDDGIYILLKEIIDNAVDEFIMGFGSRIDITLHGPTITVRDFGRGIPLGKVISCVSVINTGAKYNTDVFQFSVGLNGVGSKAVNALSELFGVCSVREGKYVKARFSRGILEEEKKGKTSEANGTIVSFLPDCEIFPEYTYNREFIEERLWNYAYLNSGLKLRLRILPNEVAGAAGAGTESAPAAAPPQRAASSKTVKNSEWITFHSRGGLKDLLEKEVGSTPFYDLAYYKGKKLEFSFTHTRNYGETQWSFVNGQFTANGGTHLSAFREGLIRGVNDFFQKRYSGIDLREGMVAAVAVKLENPVFESQTKNKLGNTDIRMGIIQEVREAVLNFLHKNKGAAESIQEKIVNNEKLRKELNLVRKEAREAARKIALKIPNLRDCKYHLGDRKENGASSIFITEGASASGSMVSCRDVYTQAIFSLRGKPQNMFGRGQANIYKNEELYNMMMALGIENDIENLRYSRIIIATDADHDGFHIRNLLLTFFLSFFEELFIQGRMFILETPLFRVRNKKETRYCYSVRERDEAVGALSAPEITRFKGLGEISPREFGQFIGADIRLITVDIKTVRGIHETMSFYMGKNNPERRSFIMNNLVSETAV